MIEVRFDVTGTKPLLCHNVQLVNKDYEITRQIADITAKKSKMTEDDRKRVADLEWYGGLYLVPGIEGPAFPAENLRRSIIEAGKITKQGTAVQRAVLFTDVHVPIEYPGTRNLETLRQNPAFRDYRPVGIQSSKTMRCRPQFVTWSVSARAILQEDVLDLRDLESILDRAGRAIGTCDGRAIGFGRFEGKVVVE